MQHLHLRIIKVVQETPDSRTYFFDAPGLNYIAGQFLTVVIQQSGKGVRRAYSFCTSPAADEYPGITVKKIQNGLVSRYIHNNWKEGDLVECLPPAGKFIMPADSKKTPVFIAAGSGIVPVVSMIKQALAKGHIKPIYLIFSNRSKESTIFFNFLNELSQNHPQLQISWFFSDAFFVNKARLNGEFLDKYFQKIKNENEAGLEVFTCGPESFMYLTEVHSRLNGVEHENFHREVFWKEEVSNFQPHEFAEGTFDVEIAFPNGRKKFLVPGNRTILSIALENNINLPWSCSAGRCSTCQMFLKTGRVYMSRNEVLTEKDINKGLILTCTAYPVEGPLSLEFI